MHITNVHWSVLQTRCYKNTTHPHICRMDNRCAHFGI